MALLIAALRFGEDAAAHADTRLQHACRAGDLAAARALVDAGHATDEDVHADDNKALRVACANGHNETARWLIERFGVSASDERTMCDAAMRARF